MKVLFYGGAFNPVSKAHIELANYVRTSLQFDKVIFMPTKDQYIKHDEGKDFVIKDEKRKKLLEEVAKENDWMIVSDYELNLESQPRTYETLCFLRNEGYDLKLLIGSDWLLKLNSGWKYVDEIMHEFGVVLMTRNHDDIEQIIENDAYLKQYKDYITCITTPSFYQNISSTKIRHALFSENIQELEQMLPKEIKLDTFLDIVKGEWND